MDMFIYVYLSMLGLVVGSFLTALVDRLHDGRKWVMARSECDSCGITLRVADLVPVFSWLLSKGQCRHCQCSISWRYPVIELATVSIFLLSYLVWPESLAGFELVKFGTWLIFVTGFVGLSVYDLRWFVLPNKLIYPLLVISSLMLSLEAVFFDGGLSLIGNAALGALACGGLFYVIFQVSKGRWIGGGDVKLGILLGILAGGFLEAVLLVLIASLLGLLVAIPLLVKKGLNFKMKLPFGPLLMAACVVIVLFGENILDWYLNISFGL